VYPSQSSSVSPKINIINKPHIDIGWLPYKASGFGRGGIKGMSLKQMIKYTPSITSVVYNIRSSKKPKGVLRTGKFSGAEIRPILVNKKKKRR
jgi:hypothetical protein